MKMSIPSLMAAFPLAYQNLAADLIRKCHDDDRQWRGSLYRLTKRGVVNLYVKMPVGSSRKSLFVGPEVDPDTKTRSEAIRAATKRARQLRKDLSVLESMGLLLTPSVSGQVIDAMAYHGLFRNGGILVGTLAYQCYPLTLGCTLPSTVLATDDADLAVAHIALRADDGLDMTSILKDADPSFKALPGLDHGTLPARFRADNGYVVDLITPTRHREEVQPIKLVELGAGAVSLQYLAWLIEDAIPAVLPWGTGVPVTVPRPERFAIHKLIVAQKRSHDQAKVEKDLAQAKALIHALEETRPGQVEDALDEAKEQGRKGWQEPIERSLKMLWPNRDGPFD